jgi:hypothetical protein
MGKQMQRSLLSRSLIATAAGLVCALSGCASISQWWHNGMKVGPEYLGAPAAVAPNWIHEEHATLKNEWADYGYWWKVFDDPVLDRLVESAYHQNLPLQIAGLRILEARAQRGIAAGNLYPQQQRVTAAYSRNRFSENMYPFGQFPGIRPFDDWMAGFDMAWELDVWGRIRRGIESADANLEAQVEGYDDALVMLQAEVARAYIQLRTDRRATGVHAAEHRSAAGFVRFDPEAIRVGRGGGIGRSAGGRRIGDHRIVAPAIGTSTPPGPKRIVPVARDATRQPAVGIGRTAPGSRATGRGGDRDSGRSASSPS